MAVDLTGPPLSRISNVHVNGERANLGSKYVSRQHFIAECVALKKYRQDYIKKLTESEILTDEYVCQLREPEFLIQLTLDCSVCVDLQILGPERLGLLELYSREYIYIIHIKRLVALRQISGN